MSINNKQIINCPKCGAESEISVWESINTVIDPDMKQKVRTGEAFRFRCPACGCETMVEYPTLYHQMDDKIMIYYVAGQDPSEAIKFMKGTYDDTMEMNAGGLLKGYLKRVVSTRNQFREKLFILDEGLDDRVIEIMKLLMTAKFAQTEPELEIVEFLFTADDGYRTFSILNGEGNWGGTEYQQEVYDALAAEYKKVLAADDEVVIDADWALAVLKNREGLQ